MIILVVPNLITMKTKLRYLFIGALTLSLMACEQENISDSENAAKLSAPVANTVVSGLQPCVSTNLNAGQHFDSGDVNLYVDLNNVYIEYTTNPNWYIKKTHLYVGSCQLIPRNNAGNPMIGQFPISNTYITGTQSVIYTIPKSSLPECFCVAAHAEVFRKENGVIVQTETAWAAGERFTNRNWATFFSACQSDCFDIEDYYFGSKNAQ